LEGVRQETFSLPPIPKGEYAEVIKGPARRLNGTSRALKIDNALVQEVLTDVETGGAKDALPLLAFTLERLYGDYGATGHLKLEHYNALGRIKGSIEAAVDRAFKAADADAKVPRDKGARLALLRRGLIPWLAGIDPDTGAPRRSVARLSEIPAEARPLIQHLVEQRLLATDVSKDTGETTIEPAHEALLRQWGLLQGWLVEDAGLLTVLDGIQRASRDWLANGKRTSWLAHSADRLRAAERLLSRHDLAAKLEPTDKDYIYACQSAEQAGFAEEQRRREQEQEQERKRQAAELQVALERATASRRLARRTMVGLVIAFVLALLAGGAGLYAFFQKQDAIAQAGTAIKATKDAQLAQSRFLTGLTEQALKDGDAATGMLLALEALPDQKSERILREPVSSTHQRRYASRPRGACCASGECLRATETPSQVWRLPQTEREFSRRRTTTQCACGMLRRSPNLADSRDISAP
jgi:hypothetical protein